MGERPVTEAARTARPDEVGLVADLAREARHEALQYRGGERWLATEAAPEPLEDRFRESLADPDAVLVVGVWEESVVGYGWARRRIRLDGSPVGRIEELFVAPDARSVGVGESLFEALLSWAGDQKLVAMDAFVLPGHRAAKNFFETFRMTAHGLIMHTRLDQDRTA